MEHLEAVGWGILSASAFPIGCILGLAWPKAPMWLRGVLMNLGGGVMLSVLTVTLFGEWLFHPHKFGHGASSVLFVCSFVGGVLFLLLDSFLEQRGGWMRRLTTKRKRLMEWRARRVRPLLAKLRRKHPTAARGSVASLQRALEDELLEQLEREGELGAAAEGDDLEMTNVERKERYLHITSWDASAHATGQVVGGEGGTGDSIPLVIESKEDEANLPAEALEPVPHVHAGSLIGLAIWVGLLIDGIPESLVIGVESASHRGVMVSLRVAFFLGNLPVAFSSSIVMYENGMSRLVILFMWLMLTATTGVGALAGSFLQEPTNNEPNSGFLYGLAVAEGIAAGAMLVMISNVMLPEAYRTGGALSGIALLSGFLVGLCLELADFL